MVKRNWILGSLNKSRSIFKVDGPQNLNGQFIFDYPQFEFFTEESRFKDKVNDSRKRTFLQSGRSLDQPFSRKITHVWIQTLKLIILKRWNTE